MFAEHGKVDILVLCAGVIARTPLAQSTDEEWDSILSVNVLRRGQPGAQAVPADVRARLRQDPRRGSIAAKNGGVASGPAYVASKAAVHGMMRWIAKAGAPHGVYANVLAPGPVETAMWASVTGNSRAVRQRHRAARPLRQRRGHRAGRAVPVLAGLQLDHGHLAGYQRRHVDGLTKEPRMASSKRHSPVIGFVGLGVMGGPMCRNMALKHGGEVIAFDMSPAAFDVARRAPRRGASRRSAEVAAQADVVFLSLPGGPQVEQVCLGPQGLAERRAASRCHRRPEHDHRGQSRATWLHGWPRLGVDVRRCAGGAHPRGRAARRTEHHGRRRSEALFARIEPLLRYMGSDVTHCGGVGCGQVVKLINNALVFENTVAHGRDDGGGRARRRRAGRAARRGVEGLGRQLRAAQPRAARRCCRDSFRRSPFRPSTCSRTSATCSSWRRRWALSAHVTQLAQRYYAATASMAGRAATSPAVIEVVDRDIEMARDSRRAMLELQGRVIATGLDFPKVRWRCPTAACWSWRSPAGRLTRVLPDGELEGRRAARRRPERRGHRSRRPLLCLQQRRLQLAHR